MVVAVIFLFVLGIVLFISAVNTNGVEHFTYFIGAWFSLVIGLYVLSQLIGE